MPNSSTVDERIVEMRIDNEKFEAGAKKTLNILEQLDKGLQGLGKQHADGFDDISQSLDKVTDRFSAMGIVGDQVIRTLTNKAMELAGQLKNVAAALTTDQIDAGWNKYADKTKAIQTIMSATSGKINDGTFADQAEQLEWVNSQIEKLNWFTDETSYNFLDMVGNIGKFTAAGRELEESVTAMEGIATWAGISGATVPEASRAMYNLSQALGMGAVTQMDWKSIENANMATYEFKQQVIETAEELGSLVKIEEGVWKTAEGHEVTVESFRENLKDRWFNSDVLLDVLNRYGGFADELGIATDELDMTASEFLKAMKKYEEGGIEGLRSSRYTEDKIQAMLPYLEELTKAEWDLGRRAFQAAQEAKTFTEAIDATKDAVSTKWMDVFEIIFGDYLQAKELWTTMAETLWDMFAGPIDRLKEILDYAFNTPVQATEEIAGSMQEAVFSTENFENRLAKMGKTMEDFGKAVREVADDDTKKLLDSYESIEDALKDNVISAELFKKAIGLLDTSTVKGKMSVERALARAGKSMKDFERAIYQTADHATLEMIEQLGGVDVALKNGAISADIFRAALAMLGIDSTNVAENVDEAVKSSGHSLDELREIALQTLRGDFGNGQERIDILEEMGYDAELIQGLAGILHDAHQRFGSYEMSDDWLMQQMAIYYRAQNLAAKTGYETFEEYVASLQDEVDAIDEAEAILHDADAILADMFGSGIFGPDGEVMTAGELFRQGLMNIMEFFSTVAEAIDTAFVRIFGGSDEAQDAIESVGSRFQAAALNFFSFTEKLKVFNKEFQQADEEASEENGFDKLVNVFSKLFSIMQLVGKAISFVWNVLKTALGFALQLLSPILSLVMLLLDGIISITNIASDSFGGTFFATIQEIGSTIIGYILEPIEKVISAIRVCAHNFSIGFKTGGIESAFQKLNQTIQVLFRDHPILLAIFNVLSVVFNVVAKVLGAIGKALPYIGDALLVLAAIFASAFGGVINVLGVVFGYISSGITTVYNAISSSKLLSDAIAFLTEKFKAFGEKLKQTAAYIKMSYEMGGLKGAIDGLWYSIKQFFPKGEWLMNFFSNLGSFFSTGAANIGDNVQNVFNSIITYVSNAWSQITGKKLEENLDSGETQSVFQRVLNMIRTVFEGLFGDPAAIEESARTFVGKVWAGILAGLREIRLRDVIGALRLSMIASTIMHISSAITVFKQIGQSIKSVPEQFSALLKDVGSAFKSFANNFRANMIIKIAFAIFMLAGAFLMFSKIPEDQLTHIFSIVAILMLIMVKMAQMLEKAKITEVNAGNVNIKNFQIIGELAGILLGFAALAFAVGVAVAALAIIDKRGGDIKKAAIVVGGLLASMALVVGILTKVLNKSLAERIKETGPTMLKIAGAMVLISLSIQMLVVPLAVLALVAKFLNENGEFATAAATIVSFIIVLGILMVGLTALLQKRGTGADTIREIGNTIMKIAGAMAIVGIAIQMLVGPIILLAVATHFLKNGEVTQAAITVGIMAAALSAIGAVMLLILTKKNMSPEMIHEAGNAMMKIAASIAIVAVAMGLIAGPLIAIALVAALLGENGGTHLMQSFAYLLVSITILAAVLTIMDKLHVDGGNLIKIAAAMALLALAMLLFTPACIAFVAVAATIASILPSLTELGDGLKKLWGMAGAMFVFALAAAVFGAALALVAVAFMVAAIGVVILAGGLILLAKAMDLMVDAFPKFVNAMIEVGETITEKGFWKKFLLAIAVITILTLATVALIALVSKIFDKTGLGEKFSKLGEKLTNFGKKLVGGVMKTIKDLGITIKDYVKNNLPALISLVEGSIIIIGLVIAGIMPTLVDTVVTSIISFFNSIADSLEAHKEELAESIAKLLRSILDVVSTTLSTVFSSDFYNNLDGISKVLFALAAIKLGSDFLKIAVPFSRLSRILAGGGLTLSLSSVATWLMIIAALAVAIGLGIRDIENRAEAAAKRRGLPNGTNSNVDEYVEVVEKEVEKVEETTEDMKQALEDGTEVTNAAVMEASSAQTDMVFDYNALLKRAGTNNREFTKYVKYILGDQYKDAVKKYGKVMTNINQLRTEADRAKFYAWQSLEEDEFAALMGSGLGDDDWITLAAKLYQDSIEEAKQTIADIEDDIRLAQEAGYSTAPFNRKLEDAKDALQELQDVYAALFPSLQAPAAAAEETVEKTGEAAEEAGTATKEAGDAGAAAMDATAKSAEDATTAAEGVAAAGEAGAAAMDTMAKSAEDAETATEGALEGIPGMFTNVEDAKEYLKSIQFGGLDMESIISGFSDTEILEFANGIGDKFKEATKSIPEGGAEGVDFWSFLFSDSVEGMGLDGLEKFKGVIQMGSPSEAFADIAATIPQGAALGVDQNASLATASVSNMALRMIQAFNPTRSIFVVKGNNIAQGLIEGISMYYQAAYNAGVNLAQSVENGFTAASKINSPSRVFMELASYIPLGIAAGISQNDDVAIDSIVILSNELQEAIMSSMAMVSTVADDRFDISPRITPVVDLSNVNSAAGAMSGVFGRGYSVSAQMAGSVNKRLSDLERLSASMSNAGQTINNGDNITFNIYAAEGMSEEAIADAVMNRMATRMTRRGVAF